MSRRRDAIVVWLAIIAGLAVGTAATTFAVGSLQQDLAAYWIAGKARSFGLDPYLNHGGSGAVPRLWDGVAYFKHSRFLYPPLAAELFRLLALVPYRIAKVAFTGAAVAGWLLTARLVARRPGRHGHALVVVLTGALFGPLYFHLERGQIDLLLLPLVFWAWSRRERAAGAGAMLALAATFKPALLGLLPVLVALGRWRWAATTLAFCGAAIVAGIVISGPALTREYATVVLPRAALYGEGGTEEMLLHESALPITDEDGDTAEFDGVPYKIALRPFDGPASASLPRLFAPTAPHWATSVLPYLFVIAGLTWAARRLLRRHEDGHRRDLDDGVVDDAELLLFTAAILACVVTPPTGWVMSFVWALPIAPMVWTAAARARVPKRLAGLLGAAWVACALSPLVSGWAAVAGTALVIAAGTAADAWKEPR